MCEAHDNPALYTKVIGTSLADQEFVRVGKLLAYGIVDIIGRQIVNDNFELPFGNP